MLVTRDRWRRERERDTYIAEEAACAGGNADFRLRRHAASLQLLSHRACKACKVELRL
jgi:hypothetical protein